MSALSSAKILAQRSAIPAVHSRVQTTLEASKARISKREKVRLMKGRWKQRGLLDVENTPVEMNTEAVKHSGTYDPWMDVDSEIDEEGFKFSSKKATIKVRSPSSLPIFVSDVNEDD